METTKDKSDLAAQSLSSSVADAIEYCATILKLPQFQRSEATVKFLRMFDHLNRLYCTIDGLPTYMVFFTIVTSSF